MHTESLFLLPALLHDIHVVDERLDSTNNACKRATITLEIIQALTDTDQPLSISNLSPKVRRRFTQINPNHLKPALNELFINTEELRSISDPQKYAEKTALDGINTAVILLLFLGLEPNKKIFKPFLTLAAAHKLWDSLRDLEKDFKQGQISPNLDLKAARKALWRSLCSTPSFHSQT